MVGAAAAAGAVTQVEGEAGELTEAQLGRIQGFLKKSVTEAVEDGYSKGIEVWLEFLEREYVAGASPGEFMQREKDMTRKTLHVVLFMVWMGEEKKSSEEQMWFMDGDLVSRGRKSSIRTTEEAREHTREREESKFLPTTVEMSGRILVHNWGTGGGHGWDTAKGRDQRMAALACRLMKDSGLRISNVGAPEAKQQDHALRDTVVAVVQRAWDTVPRRYSAGLELQAYMRVERKKRPALRGRSRAALFPEVIQLEVKILTTKTTRQVKHYVSNTLLFRRGTVEESDFIDDMLEWDLVARPAVSDKDTLFFSRVDPVKLGVKKLRSKMVAEMVKQAATHCDLDPKRFSTKSFREAFASGAQARGMTALERNVRGGWTAGSTVPDKHYAMINSVGMLGRKGAASAQPAGIPSAGMLLRRGGGGAHA
jgi:hypothetical protein